MQNKDKRKNKTFENLGMFKTEEILPFTPPTNTTGLVWFDWQIQ